MIVPLPLIALSVVATLGLLPFSLALLYLADQVSEGRATLEGFGWLGLIVTLLIDAATFLYPIIGGTYAAN